MNRDLRLFKYMSVLILLPIALAVFGGDRFRYPCQNPENWGKEMCQPPQCEVTRTCPEHIFKGANGTPIAQNPPKPIEKGCK